MIKIMIFVHHSFSITFTFIKLFEYHVELYLVHIYLIVGRLFLNRWVFWYDSFLYVWLSSEILSVNWTVCFNHLSFSSISASLIVTSCINLLVILDIVLFGSFRRVLKEWHCGTDLCQFLQDFNKQSFCLEFETLWIHNS